MFKHLNLYGGKSLYINPDDVESIEESFENFIVTKEVYKKVTVSFLYFFVKTIHVEISPSKYGSRPDGSYIRTKAGNFHHATQSPADVKKALGV